MLGVAIASSFFVVLPYGANLFVSARIKSFGGVIRRNEAANTWFEHRSKVFTALVVLTGGCHPALVMVSSNIFGLSSFSAGLTRFELRQLASIKVLNSVVLENIPQLVVQIVYAVAIDRVTDNAAFAFIASMLSVVATLLSFVIDSDRRSVGDDAMIPIQYYLSLQCTRSAPEELHVGVGGRISPHIDDLGVLEMGISPGSVRNLTSTEKTNILKHRGRRLALSLSISALWETQPKCIEIGSTVLGKSGARIHVVHFVNAGNVEAVQRCLTNQETQQQISKILTAHFELNKHSFRVECVSFEHGQRGTVSGPVASQQTSRGEELAGWSIRDRLKSLIDEYVNYQQDTLASNELKRQFVLDVVDRSIGKSANQSRLDDRVVVGGMEVNDALEQNLNPPMLQMVTLGTRGEDREDTMYEVNENKDEDDKDVTVTQNGLSYARTHSFSEDMDFNVPNPRVTRTPL